jgi:hypothetical protein
MLQFSGDDHTAADPMWGPCGDWPFVRPGIPASVRRLQVQVARKFWCWCGAPVSTVVTTVVGSLDDHLPASATGQGDSVTS